MRADATCSAPSSALAVFQKCLIDAYDSSPSKAAKIKVFTLLQATFTAIGAVIALQGNTKVRTSQQQFAFPRDKFSKKINSHGKHNAKESSPRSFSQGPNARSDATLGKHKVKSRAVDCLLHYEVFMLRYTSRKFCINLSCSF